MSVIYLHAHLKSVVQLTVHKLSCCLSLPAIVWNGAVILFHI